MAFEKTVDTARGKWFGILSSLGVDQSFLKNKQGPCPICGGKDRFRFDDKEGNGTWFCNKCGSGTGIYLVMKLRNCEYKDACKAIDEVSGKASMKTINRGKKDDRSRIDKEITNSRMTVEGDEVSSYLSARGLITPQKLKTHPAMMYYEDGVALGKYPAMLSRIYDKNDNLAGLHVTYLQGESKAPVPSPRKMLKYTETMKGGAVRLFPRAEKLAVAEGIESAIAYHIITGIPCWATTSAQMLSSFEPPDGVKTIVIAGDADENYVGQHHAYALADLLSRKGFKVEVHIPSALGNDWCDVLTMMNAAVKQ